MKIKLEFKMKNRIGKKVLVKNHINIKSGIITGFHIRTIDEGTPEQRYTVDYLIEFEGVQELVYENLVVILN